MTPQTPLSTTPAYIGLGSNIGDPQGNLKRAWDNLSSLQDATIGASSPVYRTEPQGVRDQPWFANQVVRLDCGPSWTSEKLLHALQDIESRMGRVRGRVNGPRVIDLDLLLFGGDRRSSAELSLPHPRVQKRAFVLVPLLDIAPGLIFPDGRGVVDALHALTYHVRERTIRQPEIYGREP